jgi:peroxiredoxin
VNLPELAKRDMTLVAISVDEAPTGKNLREKLNLGFPILSDPRADSLKAFGVFDKENEIAWASIFVIGRDASSPSGKVIHRWLADTFSQRVAAADALGALDKL